MQNPDELRKYSQECWRLASATENSERKAFCLLLAQAWMALAGQVEDRRREARADEPYGAPEPSPGKAQAEPVAP